MLSTKYAGRSFSNRLISGKKPLYLVSLRHTRTFTATSKVNNRFKMENQPVSQLSLGKAAVLAVCLALLTVICWEIYLRNHGVTISYDDGPPLWSDKRAMAYPLPEHGIVFIGSSRIKYDLDIPTWENLTGLRAVQLAIEGSSPRPVLEDLANDPNFRSRLVVDVTEGLFFSNSPGSEERPRKNIKYYHERTPAQRASFGLNKMLESKLVLLDKDNFSLNAQLDALEIPSRPGVFMMPIFPMDFQRNTFERQMYMTPRFVADTALQHRVSGIWQFFGKMARQAPPMPPEELETIFASVKAAVGKIKARGGEVLFVRTPSSGPAWMGEQMGFPREKYWDRLLAEAGCPGIHFADYPETAQFICPEDSHLSPQDAVVFTRHLMELVDKKIGLKR